MKDSGILNTGGRWEVIYFTFFAVLSKFSKGDFSSREKASCPLLYSSEKRFSWNSVFST